MVKSTKQIERTFQLKLTYSLLWLSLRRGNRNKCPHALFSIVFVYFILNQLCYTARFKYMQNILLVVEKIPFTPPNDPWVMLQAVRWRLCSYISLIWYWLPCSAFPNVPLKRQMEEIYKYISKNRRQIWTGFATNTIYVK